MKRNERTAFNQLKRIGAPAFEGRWDHTEDGFRISGEHNDEVIWADYYAEFCSPEYEFGVNPMITEILTANGLYAEWCNPGVLNVYDI